MGERTLRPTIMKIMIVKRMIVMTVMRMIMMVVVMVMVMVMMVMVVAMVAHCDIVSVDDREDNPDEPIFLAGYFLK